MSNDQKPRKSQCAAEIQAKVRRVLAHKKLPEIFRIEPYPNRKGQEVAQFRWGWDSQSDVNPGQRRGFFYLGERREVHIALKAIADELPMQVRVVLRKWDSQHPLTESEQKYADQLDRPTLLFMGLLDWDDLTSEEQAVVLDYTDWLDE